MVTTACFVIQFKLSIAHMIGKGHSVFIRIVTILKLLHHIGHTTNPLAIGTDIHGIYRVESFVLWRELPIGSLIKSQRHPVGFLSVIEEIEAVEHITV